MAYKYEKFLADANEAGLMDQFSEQDLQIAKGNPEYGLSLLSLQKDRSNAATAEQKLLATEAANQLRKSYGAYSAGAPRTASAYEGSYSHQISDLLDRINDYGSFNYDNQNSYQQLLDSIVNQQPFSYDLQSDPSWTSYKKAYMREGDRASANALAQAAAASGGRPSSYAMTAAQQAGNYYAGQLADIIPTLEQNAYTRYLNDFNNRLSGLGALENDRDFDYQAWMNDYNMLQNSLGNYREQDATDYQRYLDAQARKRQAYNDQRQAIADYQQYLDAEEQEQQGDIDTDDQLDEVRDGGDDDRIVDMGSIIDLGYGPISENYLNQLVASGEVREVDDGKVIRFEKVEQPQTPDLPGSYLWNFTKDQMNNLIGNNSNKNGNNSINSNSNKNANSAKKRTGGGAGNGSAAGGLKSQLERVALLM